MRPYHALNRLFEGIGQHGAVQICTPYVRNIGNCAEEIYYALLKARRENKKALFLFPLPLFWKFRIDLANQELFEIESDHSLPNGNAWCRLAGYILTVIFSVSCRAYLKCRHALLTLSRVYTKFRLAPYHNIYYVVPSIGRRSLWNPEGVKQFSFEVVAACKWREQYDRYLPVRLKKERRQRAERLRVEMGIPLDAWYVCLHVREGGFRNDAEISWSRYASILNYRKGIQAVTDAGGFVVRLGDSSMMPLPPMPRVIDYPRTPFKSALMDVYLIAECRFYIGVNSGPLDIARLFQKRMALANLCEWTISFSRQKGDLAIIKHVFSRSRQRWLSLKELLLEPFDCQFLRELETDYVWVENTPEEIRDLVIEALNMPEDYEITDLQKAFNRGREIQIRQWLEDKSLVFSPVTEDDMIERYRFASRCDTGGGSIGRKYVEENWWYDSMAGSPEEILKSAASGSVVGSQT